MQISPCKELTSFIKHYLFLERRRTNFQRTRLFSDGNTGMVFSLRNNITVNLKSNIFDSLPKSFLYGQITEFKDICFNNETSFIIIVFQPNTLNKLAGLPVNMLENKIISAENVFGKEALEMEEKLFEKTTTIERSELLNAFFLKHFSKTRDSNELLISSSINFILKHKGIISVQQLVKYIGYSERQIERKFLESVGIAPKRFINIVRLHNFLKHLSNNTHFVNLTKITYEAGYFDQSHLIGDFKRNTGMTPTSYLNKTKKIAVNLVEILSSNNF